MAFQLAGQALKRHSCCCASVATAAHGGAGAVFVPGMLQRVPVVLCTDKYPSGDACALSTATLLACTGEVASMDRCQGGQPGHRGHQLYRVDQSLFYTFKRRASKHESTKPHYLVARSCDPSARAAMHGLRGLRSQPARAQPHQKSMQASECGGRNRALAHTHTRPCTTPQLQYKPYGPNDSLKAAKLCRCIYGTETLHPHGLRSAPSSTVPADRHAPAWQHSPCCDCLCAVPAEPTYAPHTCQALCWHAIAPATGRRCHELTPRTQHGPAAASTSKQPPVHCT